MKPVLIFFLVMLIIVSGCTQNFGNFEYKRDGKTYTNFLMLPVQPAMEWVAKNTPENVVIASWWDYGHMIRGVGNRSTVVFTPSREILNTTASAARGERFPTEYYGELSDYQDIKNVAAMLTTTNTEEAAALMEHYNSDYLLVTTYDYGKSYVLYSVSGIEATETEEIGYWNYTINTKSIFYRMLKLQNVSGFEKAYADNVSVIYKLAD